MAFFYTKHTSTRTITSGGLDHQNPFSNGLVLVNSLGYDPTIKKKLDIAGSTPLYSPTGRGLSFSGDGSGILYGTYRAIPQGSQAHTVLVAGFWPSTGRGHAFSQGVQSSPYAQSILVCGIDHLTAAADGNITFMEFGGGGSVAVSASATVTSAADNKYHVAVGVRNGAAANTKIYIDGVNRTTATSGNGNYNDGVSQYTTIGNDSNYNGTDRVFTKPIHLVLVWNRALSDAEIRKISDNPWQVFAPKETFIFITNPKNISLTVKSLSLTKNPINLVRQLVISVSSLSKTITKNSINLLNNKKIIETVSSLTLSPKANNLLLNRRLIEDSKLVDLVVNTVNLVYSPVSNYTLPITSKNITLTKNTLNLLVSRLSQVTTHSLVLFKNPINLLSSRLSQLVTKSLILTTSVVGLVKSSSGSYNLLVNRAQFSLTKNNIFNLYRRIFPVDSSTKDLILYDLFGSYGRFITLNSKSLSLNKNNIFYNWNKVLGLSNKSLSLTKPNINLLSGKKVIVNQLNLDLIPNNNMLYLGRKSLIGTKSLFLSKSLLYLKYTRIFGISQKVLDLVLRDVILSQGLVSDQEIIEAAVTLIVGTSTNLYDLSEYHNILITPQSQQVIIINNQGNTWPH